MKFDMGYKRFRHFGLDKVTMDFAFFAIAFNLKKMCSKIAREGNSGDDTPLYGLILCPVMPLLCQNMTSEESCRKIAA